MPISSDEFTIVQRLVFDRAAIVLEPGKEYLVESRLTNLARDEKLASVHTLIDSLRLAPKPAIVQKVVEAMTTNETSFFRDIKPWDALRKEILPKLIEARRTTRSLSIWCGAASTGQEPYTIALTIREHFPELSSWNVKIVATDISLDVLAKARAGRYTQLEVNRGLPAPMLVRHFSRDGMHWKLNDDVRRLVEFKELNLSTTWPLLPKPDIVFMRNVMIYLDLPTRRTILNRISGMLAKDGYLFLGAGETTLNLDQSYERVDIDKAGCFRLSALTPARLS